MGRRRRNRWWHQLMLSQSPRGSSRRPRAGEAFSAKTVLLALVPPRRGKGRADAAARREATTTAVCRRMPGALAAAAKPPPLLPATALGPADAWLVARQCISSSERRGGAKSRSPKAGLLEERGEREPVERRGKKVSSPRSLSRFTKNFPLASKSFLLLFFSRQQFSALLLLEPLPPDL